MVANCCAMGRSSAEATNAFLMRIARCEGRRLRRALMRDDRLLVFPVVFLVVELLVEGPCDAEPVCDLAAGFAVDVESELWAAHSISDNNPAVAPAIIRVRNRAGKDEGRRFIESL
jgi:hypothetical protein